MNFASRLRSSFPCLALLMSACGGSPPAADPPAPTPAPSATQGDTSEGTRLPVRPSSGCGAASPSADEATLDVDGTPAHYIVSLPPGYDGRTAYPLVFGLHGRNRTDQDCKDTDCRGLQSEVGSKAIVVYMKSLGGTGWEGPTERELNVKFFEKMLGQAKQSYCVDENRVFAAGTSSGAIFTNLLACRFGDQLRGVIPVAGFMPETEGCKGPVAALLIHGVDDDKIPLDKGIAARDQYRAWSSCASLSEPPVSALHERVVAKRESHECAEYQGCSPRLAVVWCEHSEGGYDGSTHGWPNFGGQAIAEFMQRF